jgi:hypothetical protein
MIKMGKGNQINNKEKIVEEIVRFIKNDTKVFLISKIVFCNEDFLH